MNDAAALGAMKWTESRNRIRIFMTHSRFKLAVIVLFSAAFWVSLYKLFHLGLEHVHRVALTHDFRDLVGSMFYIFFFALTVMLVFSNAIILYTGLFRSRETAFLLATPARPESCQFRKLLP